MNIFLRPEGYITSRFADDSSYRKVIHKGIDFYNGFKSPCRAIGAGKITKVRKGSDNLQDRRLVWQEVMTPLGLFEVHYVHCWHIFVEEGDHILGGQIIYTEGNTGTSIYSGGVQVKPEDKPSGKGSHSHISVWKDGVAINYEPFLSTPILARRVRNAVKGIQWKFVG